MNFLVILITRTPSIYSSLNIRTFLDLFHLPRYSFTDRIYESFWNRAWRALRSFWDFSRVDRHRIIERTNTFFPRMKESKPFVTCVLICVLFNNILRLISRKIHEQTKVCKELFLVKVLFELKLDQWF